MFLHNIDFFMVAFRLLCKDYRHFARCMVPLGSQKGLSMEGRVALLQRLTKKFSDEEIRKKHRLGTERKRNA